MDFPLVSVIIPTYNGEDHLGDAIQSVLDQTYPNFELIVVDDASPGNTSEVIEQFDDPRLKYISHERNRGVIYARITALHASTGEVIAFLDQDDRFHPEKLALHVAFLEKNPDVGFTYNGYFNLNHSSDSIRDIYRPPQFITLKDLVLGFPLPPSVWVLRREWAFREELWEENTFFRGREIVFCGRLFMAGCKFAMVDRVLNYRRYHAGRVFGDLAVKCEAERTCQEIVFLDPRCSEEVLAIRNMAAANIYLLWTHVAFIQEETTLGQEFVRKAVGLKPALIRGEPCELANFFLIYSIDEEKASHRMLLGRIFDQFPPELAHISHQSEWAIAQGYLLKGTRAVMWDRMEDAQEFFDQAVRLGARLDEPARQTITDQLLSYETEFGIEATEKVIQGLLPYLNRIDKRNSVRFLKGWYSVNRAFQSFRNGEYKTVSKNIQAVIADPKYLANRGVLSILLRSTFSMWAKPS